MCTAAQMVTAGALCALHNKYSICYSPFARTPYNPHSRQMRIKFIISGDSDATSGASGVKYEIKFLFLLLLFSLQTQHTQAQRAWPPR